MTLYANLSGNSPVYAYELKANGIIVRFNDGVHYLYDDTSTSAYNIQKMQVLAGSGKGIASFINQQVRNGYDRKW